MAPKKSSHNAFMAFTLEWKANHGRHMSLNGAVAEAGLLWQKMNAEQRGPYIEQSKQTKLHGRSNTQKLACTGTPLALIEKEQQEQENAERQMKRTIETTVRNSYKNNELENQAYYFIMVNYFTKTMKGNVHVPAEISVAEYTLKNGVNRTYHTFINPSVSIYGHQYEAQQHANTTHKLPLPPNAMGETNLGRIYNDILKFLCNDETGEYPPVYSNVETISVVESVLEFLQYGLGAKNVKLRLYSIQYLFFILKEATCDKGELKKPTSFYLTDAHFEKDFFEYEPGIACDYHEECDRSKYCTLSCVIRWGYMFSDFMCADIAIPMVPGRHVPKNTNLACIIKPGSSRNTTENHYEPNNMVSTCNISTASASMHSAPVSEDAVCRSDHPSIVRNSSSSSFAKALRATQNDEGPLWRSSQMTVEDTSLEYNDSCDNPWATRSQREIECEPDPSYFTVDYSQELDDNIPTTSAAQPRAPTELSWYSALENPDECDNPWHIVGTRRKRNVELNASRTSIDDEESGRPMRDYYRSSTTSAMGQGFRGQGFRGRGAWGRGSQGGSCFQNP